MTTGLKKRKSPTDVGESIEEFTLFDSGALNSEGDDNDSTDSEESVYSDLGEEEDSSDDEGESVESFEEAKGSEEEDSSGSGSSDSEAEGPTSNQEKSDIISASEIKPKEDEYEYDSSDEEDIRNTIGNIPMEWYKEYEHVGYDLSGKKIVKPAGGDELDEFLEKMDNPNYWRTVKDKSTGQNVVLSEEDVQVLRQIRRGKSAGLGTDPYAPWVDTFSSEVMIHPLSNRPEHKRSFIPSKLEKRKVGQLVHAIKMGWIKPRVKKEEDDIQKFYELWDKEESEISKRHQHHIPAPKLPLPGHSESYNPPPEYLFSEEEKLAWKDKDPEERRQNFIPEKYDSLRKVPAYNRFINERFERCLDLYLCPRQRKMRMNVDPEDLLPKLPKPRDLQPFPMVQSLVYKGHEGLIRCISADPTGQWLASGSDDHTLRLWEVSTARCLRTITVEAVVKDVAWNPNSTRCLVAAAVGETVYVINPHVGDKLVISKTDEMLAAVEPPTGEIGTTKWETCTGNEFAMGYRVKITHKKAVTQVTWHNRGDYFSCLTPQSEAKSIFIHQLSKYKSQTPFKKAKGLVQCVQFHPTRPFFFVATQRYVRVYNLLKQELTKKLLTNCKWVSTMAVHPGGDNLIVGSYDMKLSWFDMDLSTKPYQTLRHHKKAIRKVCYHKKYPLFASASDDGTLIVCHGRVFNDLLQNPLIVPVKVLRGHETTAKLGVLDCVFHPTQPWIFSSGADHSIRLFT